MHASEQRFAAEARRHNYRVYRNGWPDFLLTKGTQVIAVEVKGHGQTMARHQRVLIRVLEALGLPVFISREGRWPGNRVRWQNGAHNPWSKLNIRKSVNPTLTCPICRAKWLPRVPDPVRCPRCQTKLNRTGGKGHE